MAKTDFKVGADPEFGFIENNGASVSADGIIEVDQHDAQFGVDGCGRVAEIRPTAAMNPLSVVRNIRNAMLDGMASNPETKDYKWKAGSIVDGEPIGGHIHFGTKGIKAATFPTENFLKCLDRYLAYPVLLLEDPDEAVQRRQDHDYGGLSDYRPQNWGFEYRTPSSWLTSPYIAGGVLCLAKAIVWETLYNKLNERKAVETDNDEFDGADLKAIRKKYEKAIWKDIQKFELYKLYREPIDLLNTLIEKHRNWFPSCGMKTAWGIGGQLSAGPIRKTSLNTIWEGVSS